MIIINKGNIKVSGTKVDLLSELAIIVKGLYEEGKIPKDELEYAFKVAFMNEEEFEKADQELKRNKEQIEKFLEELFGGNKIDI